MLGVIIQFIGLIVAYLLGSIPSALIIGKAIKGIDIREHGSKNMGATNAFRVLGFKWGLLTFIIDAVKGGLMVAIMKYLMPLFSFYQESYFIINTLFYGALAFLGHLFPIFAHFKGGKGVSTGFGALLAYAPIVSLTGLVIFLIVLGLSRMVALASVLAFTFGPIITILDGYLLHHGVIDWWLFATVTIIAILVIIRHIANLRRIKKHEEKLINFDAIEDDTQPAFVENDNKKNPKN